jgi:hypothetical protein
MEAAEIKSLADQSKTARRPIRLTRPVPVLFRFLDLRRILAEVAQACATFHWYSLGRSSPGGFSLSTVLRLALP